MESVKSSVCCSVEFMLLQRIVFSHAYASSRLACLCLAAEVLDEAGMHVCKAVLARVQVAADESCSCPELFMCGTSLLLCIGHTA